MSFGGEGRVVRSFVAALLAAVCVFPSVARASGCALSNGQFLVLRSSDFDPDVLVWDTRQRAMDYVNAIHVSANEVLAHTLLAGPGTRAVVVQCAPASVKPKYTSEIFDTVGIKLTTGPNRGRYGWVTSDDVHTAATAQTTVQ
jgi:hypothetical protein